MSKRLPMAKMLTFGLLPSCMKKLLYRMGGNQIGRHVKMHLGAIVQSKGKFIIGDDTELGYFTSITGNEVQIGKRCNLRSAVIVNANRIVIGNDVTISETAIIRAGHLSPKSELVVEDLVHVFPHTTIDPSCRILLGEECAVGPGCSIFTHGSYKNILDGYPVSYGDVSIGRRVELTYNVFVAPGVSIGDDTVVAYGSFVNKDLPSNVLAAGLPAVVKRTKEQFAPEPSEEKKKSMLNDIMSEFKNHLSFIGLEVDEGAIQLKEEGEVVVDGCKFDIFKHCCDKPISVLSKELRRFLSRYGIRFKIEE